MSTSPSINYRLGKSRAFKVLIIIFAFLITIPLFLIIGYIFKAGISTINWNFITNIPKPVGEIGGGIANALIGSLIIVGVAALMAIPIGIMCGIYLSENRNSKLAYWSRLATKPGTSRRRTIARLPSAVDHRCRASTTQDAVSAPGTISTSAIKSAG